MQGHLGAFFLEIDPGVLRVCPTGRHEAACASGSIAILAASAEIEAGRYDLAAVVGLEQMKTVDSATGGDFLGTAAWYEREGKGKDYPFPATVRPARRRVRQALRAQGRAPGAHLVSQLRQRAAESARADAQLVHERERPAAARPSSTQVIGGRIKVRDCSQVTDGCSVALPRVGRVRRQVRQAARHEARRAPADPRLGPSHRADRLRHKVAESKDNPYVLPHTRQAIVDAFERAGIEDVLAVNRASRRTTASPLPSTWRSTISA